MKTIRIQQLMLLVLALFMALVATAQDVYPEDGWRWGSEASGRGYLFERQDETIFITSFHYTDAGAPEWLGITGDYVAAEAGSTDIGSMTGDVFRADNGQCIACPYVAPETSDSIQGPATIFFHTNQSATLNWTGESIQIERFFFGFSNLIPLMT